MPADTASSETADMISHWEYFETLSTEAIQNRPCLDLAYIAERTPDTEH